MNEDFEALKKARKRIFLTAYNCGSAHLASAFSIVEILHVLYERHVLNYDSKNPGWEQRDRLILSKGHGSLALYDALCTAGYFTEKELFNFCRPGSLLGGEPNTLETPGVEASTGSLGHGLSIGVGMALAAKADGLNNKIYVILGDGECEEGSVWEAVMSAAAFKLDNIVAILDQNRLQKMDFVNEIMGIDTWKERFEVFGWQVKQSDGHNIKDLYHQLTSPWEAKKPHLLLADTTKGKGISLMENAPGWHFRMPNKRELKVFMSELGITEEELEQCKKHI
ncbi:transketolase [Harryflintia acetispora]|uniref:transketolase n=1 Tax=Harryflintia acetispora TaxID=1849041 RepID=UPI0018984262|nr:transketolase [Harryflintia acetispora]